MIIRGLPKPETNMCKSRMFIGFGKHQILRRLYFFGIMVTHASRMVNCWNVRANSFSCSARIKIL
jgi:hypothetical protein